MIKYNPNNFSTKKGLYAYLKAKLGVVFCNDFLSTDGAEFAKVTLELLGKFVPWLFDIAVLTLGFPDTAQWEIMPQNIIMSSSIT